ncbi:Wall-associated receptor kinase galacturonan-binding domain-containing protein [Dioscorea alata]|uniref:Wall-associated receptor kinase galacturonan-binding domain-containing protein n=1 Tax=Dioscorea alata TaxID=55571 RepID=A0ACB7UG53_DIOAL|nr:Wall-associated receptor kinase galacturonan-binding domain-containing protein [Dioscorea alata]
MVILNVPSPAAVPSAPLFTILFLFFFFLFPSSTTFVSAVGDYCASSSCGNLTNIRYPFRLKDDPSNCGDPNYELTCDNLNHTLLTLFSHSYYVTNITYYGDGINFDVTVEYVEILEKYNNINNGSCSHLPLPTSLTRSQMMSYKYYRAEYGLVTLVNCSKEVNINKSMWHHYKVNNLDFDYFKLVPCLSHNNSFIL